MILRDPVHGLVAFEGAAERVVTALLATRELQRLRRVRALGLTSLVFPGAEHSRFAHAVGAAHVMVRLLRRLQPFASDLPSEARIDDEACNDALAAALLHDLGHGPFSHLFEQVIPSAVHHEQWTAAILRDPQTDVHRALEGLSKGMAERVASLLEGQYRLGYVARAVSGTLDVDRCDYLLRDSHMTGVRYGLYDLEWLLQGLAFGEAPSGEHVIAIEGRKGLPPIEGFFFSRHFMYQQVYHHKATRAAQCLVDALFARIAELTRDGAIDAAMPRALRSVCRGDSVSIADYLALDDIVVEASIAECERSSDQALRELATSLRARRLPKTIPLPTDPSLREEALATARECVARHGYRPETSVWLDVATDTPYEEPADPRSPEGLWVAIRRQPIQRLGDASFALGQLRNKTVETARLVFPAAVRDEVERAVERVLARNKGDAS